MSKKLLSARLQKFPWAHTRLCTCLIYHGVCSYNGGFVFGLPLARDDEALGAQSTKQSWRRWVSFFSFVIFSPSSCISGYLCVIIHLYFFVCSNNSYFFRGLHPKIALRKPWLHHNLTSFIAPEALVVVITQLLVFSFMSFAPPSEVKVQPSS